MWRSGGILGFALLGGALWLLPAAAAQARGIDCRRAASAAERMICATPALRADDEQLAQQYQLVRDGIKVAGDVDALLVDQQHWIRRVRDACRSAMCMEAAYIERIRYLDGWDRRFGPLDRQDFSCPVPPPAASFEGCSRTFQCAENSDYSYFQLVTEDCAAASSIKLYRHADRMGVPVLLQSLSHRARLDFPDRNGFAQIDVLFPYGMYGDAGHDLYRYDPVKKVLYSLFFSGHSYLYYFDGYLVEGIWEEKTSELDAHKVHRQGVRDVVEPNYFVIEFDWRDLAQGRCGYFASEDKVPLTHRIEPPDAKWYDRFCGKDGKAK